MNIVILAVAFLAYWQSPAVQNTFSGLYDVPVVVADYSNQLVPGLTPSDFSVRIADALSPVGEVSIDAGPKRVAVILDASSSVPTEGWKLQTEMAIELVSHARPGDQFLLLIVGSEAASAAFSSASEVTSRLRELGTAPRNNAPSEKIYDVLLEAARHFDPFQFGDTIFSFGHYRDSGSTVSFDTVRDLLLKKRLRFLAISFEDRFADVPRPFDPNKPIPNFHRAPLETLSDDTGYYFSFHDVRSLAYPRQTPLFKNFLGDLYRWIAEPYRVRIPIQSWKDGSSLEVSITEMKARKINQSGLHFPHLLYENPQPTAKLSNDGHSGQIP
jgi:hypothetical protein